MRGVRTGGDPRNRDFAGPHLTVADRVPDELLAIGYDPQTAGGLLVSLPAEKAHWSVDAWPHRSRWGGIRS